MTLGRQDTTCHLIAAVYEAVILVFASGIFLGQFSFFY